MPTVACVLTTIFYHMLNVEFRQVWFSPFLSEGGVPGGSAVGRLEGTPPTGNPIRLPPRCSHILMGNPIKVAATVLGEMAIANPQF
ncbi:MAG: hypothetical protein ACP5D7_08495 [Limnospira sp.]